MMLVPTMPLAPCHSWRYRCYISHHTIPISKQMWSYIPPIPPSKVYYLESLAGPRPNAVHCTAYLSTQHRNALHQWPFSSTSVIAHYWISHTSGRLPHVLRVSRPLPCNPLHRWIYEYITQVGRSIVVLLSRVAKESITYLNLTNIQELKNTRTVAPSTETSWRSYGNTNMSMSS